MGKFLITEEEKKHILEMYGLLSGNITPLQKLMECRFTSDGKYVVYEGNVYLTETGELTLLNEDWSLSDILHTGADLLSVGMDFVIPGSGAVIDVLNAISYIIEAQFKNEKEKDSLYIMAAITFAFVILPGPLQAISVPLKRAVKTGAGMASKVVVEGLKIIGGSLNTLLMGIPKIVNDALKSPLAKNILGSWGGKISGFINKFTSRIKPILEKITGKSGTKGTIELGGEVTQKSIKKVTTDVSGEVLQKQFTIPNCHNRNFCDTTNIIKSLFNVINSKVIFNPSKIKILQKTNIAGREVAELELENGSKVLFYKSSGQNVATTGKEAGEWFVIPGFANDGWFIKTKETINLTKGGNKYLTDLSKFLEKEGLENLGKTSAKKTSKEVVIIVRQSDALINSNIKSLNGSANLMTKIGIKPGTTFSKRTISNLSDEFVSYVEVGTKISKKVPTWEFIKTFILKPSAKLNSTFVPAIVKAIIRCVNPNGTIDTNQLSQINITQEQSQKELEYLSGLVAEYEGDSKNYTVNNNVSNIQNALIMLGYPLPKFGADGKFGPETKDTLKKFQQDNNLTSSIGKMDRFTTKKLSELLKTKNIKNSENIQSYLNEL
jgi:hypothetical protein